MVKLPARVSQVQRTAESPGHKQTEKHAFRSAFCCISDKPANALPRLCAQESTCSSAVQGQSSVFCFFNWCW